MQSERKAGANDAHREKTEEHHTTQNNLHKDLLLLMDNRGFGVTRVRFAVLDQKAGLRTLSHLTVRRSFHAVKCHVTLFIVAAVVAAAFDFFCAQARASMRERVCSGTQLDEQLLLLLRVAAVVEHKAKNADGLSSCSYTVPGWQSSKKASQSAAWRKDARCASDYSDASSSCIT